MVKDLQTFLRTLPGVTSSISFVDYLELLEAGLDKGERAATCLVDEQGNIDARRRSRSPSGRSRATSSPCSRW